MEILFNIRLTDSSVSKVWWAILRVFANLRDGRLGLFVATVTAVLDGIDGDNSQEQNAGDNKREFHFLSLLELRGWRQARWHAQEIIPGPISCNAQDAPR